MPATVERASPEDVRAILRLIADSGLPADGLLDHLASALVARVDGRVVGCAALEVYGDGALLRSVAVESALLGTGIGRQIVQSALDLARQRDAPTVYLLTTTAEGYFPRFGFRPIARADVPDGVRGSIEFKSACPASATVMACDLVRQPPRS